MTRYYLKYQPKNGQRENFTSFDSMALRTIWILDHALDITMISTWEANEVAA